MKIIERYLAKNVVLAIAFVTLLLIGLQLFILLVNQLESIGKGDYGILQALLFVCLQMPYEVYLFFPMASLLGALIGLGTLAQHRELIILRAAGMSIGQITWAVFKVALMVILVVTLLGEYVVPRLLHQANDVKMKAVSGGQTVRTAKGIWLRQQRDFLMIGGMENQKTLLQIYQFHFGDDHRLMLTRKIAKAYWDNGIWRAQDVVETHFYKDHTTVKTRPQLLWHTSFKPSLYSVATLPDEMTLPALYRYWRGRAQNNQPIAHEKLIFLQRIFQPATTLVMMLLAIPFIFGPLRSSTMGSKLLIGATIGFSFYIMNKLLGSMSDVFRWSPELAASLPTLLFAVLGMYLMKRAK